MTVRISIGKIVNTHGIHGEVRIQVFSDSLERFEGMSQILVSRRDETYGGVAGGETGDRMLTITGLRYHRGMAMMTFEGIDTMTQAEAIKGWFLQVDESELPPLPEGRYYIYQLKGLEVWEGDILYGTLTDVMQPGSNDVYVVKGVEGEILIPALESVIGVVDLEKGRMEVTLPAGLLDIYR